MPADTSMLMPELLAPAGDAEAMRAAVANGADAVYFGLEDFNARRRAANFTLDGLPGLMDHLHSRNVRGYVAFNTLIFPDELDRAADYVAGIAAAGADAVIVQDLGLVRLVREMCPTLPVHASTQMTQTEQGGIAFLRSLGVIRVILARELPLADIALLARETGLELEVFVHGALCISFSGQCLASESLWGRSANRGMCGQACRLPYQVVVDGEPIGPGGGRYPLSPKDLAAYDRIEELVAAGVRSFKIEGRLKDAAYVAGVTRVYREAIDAAVERRPFSISRDRMDELAQGFSRGFTHGFLDGPHHRDLVHGMFPKSRGMRVGTVVGRTARGVVVQLESQVMRDRSCAAEGRPAKTATAVTSVLKPGDGVVFDEGRPDREEQGGRVYSVEPIAAPAAAGRRSSLCVEITFGRGDVKLASVGVGSVVWKTDDPVVQHRLETTYSRDTTVHREPITFFVEISADRLITLRARDVSGRHSSAISAQPLQEAIRHPLTVGMLREQLRRLGDTPFELGPVALTGPGGPAETLPVLAPKSLLNDLRRRVVEGLFAERLASSRHVVVSPGALTKLRAEVARGSTAACGESRHLHVLVRREEQLPVVLDRFRSGGGLLPAMVYVEMDDWAAWGRAVSAARSAGMPVVVVPPRILVSGESERLDRLIDLQPDAVLVRSLGLLRRLRERVPSLPLVGDYSLNVANELAGDVLRRSGLVRLAPGLDLNLQQWSALCSAAPGVGFEAVIHAHVPMFHMAHCVAAAVLAEGDDCTDCGHPCRGREIRLRDRLEVDHPVFVDAGGRTTIYNGNVQSAAEVWGELDRIGVRHLRIELLDESPRQAASLLDAYADLVTGRAAAGEVVRRVEEACRTRVVRGTWEWA